MTKQQIINCLRKYRYAPEHRRGKQGATVANVAALANTHSSHIKDLRDYSFSRGPRWLERVARAVEMIENGEVRFTSNLGKGPMKGSRKLPTGEPLWTIEWVNVPKRRPFPLEKIHAASDHASWARCRTCQGEKWNLAIMNGKRYMMCRDCVGPVHWPIMGARASTKDEKEDFYVCEGG